MLLLDLSRLETVLKSFLYIHKINWFIQLISTHFYSVQIRDKVFGYNNVCSLWPEMNFPLKAEQKTNTDQTAVWTEAHIKLFLCSSLI